MMTSVTMTFTDDALWYTFIDDALCNNDLHI